MIMMMVMQVMMFVRKTGAMIKIRRTGTRMKMKKRMLTDLHEAD